MHPLTVTLVQTNLHWEDRAANLSMLGEKIAGVPDRTHLIILPEMFSTGFSMDPEKLSEKMNGTTVEWMKTMALKKKTIITGSIIIEEEGKYHNRMIWMLPDGRFWKYDKRHLFSYAGEEQHYTPGSERIIASVNGWRILLQICYDLRFPVWSRQSPAVPGTAEYDMILYVANWPQRRSHAWKTLLQARAIENLCYTVGVNRVGEDGNGIYHSGDSMVADPLGEILYTRSDDEDIFTMSFDRQMLEEIRNRFAFLNDADRFSIYP